MLTRAYLLGWLDFKDKTPLSKYREVYIINYLESQEVQELLQIRALQRSPLLQTGVPELIQMAEESFSAYSELALPYLHKNNSMTVEESNKLQLQEIKDFLEKANSKNKK